MAQFSDTLSRSSAKRDSNLFRTFPSVPQKYVSKYVVLLFQSLGSFPYNNDKILYPLSTRSSISDASKNLFSSYIIICYTTYICHFSDIAKTRYFKVLFHFSTRACTFNIYMSICITIFPSSFDTYT